jgi:hypothetical protein
MHFIGGERGMGLAGVTVAQSLSLPLINLPVRRNKEALIFLPAA